MTTSAKERIVQRFPSALRFAVAALAILAILDSIGVGSLVATALVPLLVWAMFTARSWTNRLLEAVVSAICLLIAIGVIGYVNEMPTGTVLVVGSGAGASLVVALLLVFAHRGHP